VGVSNFDALHSARQFPQDIRKYSKMYVHVHRLAIVIAFKELTALGKAKFGHLATRRQAP
jgi:hypothetical protein